jgi:hypothetical protein
MTVLIDLPDDGLQQIGDALLATLDTDPNRTLAPIVDRLISALAGRQWDGDSELTDALRVATVRRRVDVAGPGA